MSDFSPRRTLFLTLVLLLLATAASATTPSGRFDARMVYDPATTQTILFGGSTATDVATKASYEFSDTWAWNGLIWTQLFPLHIPTARYGHVMVYDSARNRIVMFGGRTGGGKTDLNDTWVFKGGDWTQIVTPNSPPARILAGGAYDPNRDRFVLFGGASISADGKTVTPFHDTWEFDGTTWTHRGGEGPDVLKPILVYDAARNQVVMLAINSKVETQMYAYDPAASTWNQVKPSTLPGCANEGMAVFQESNNTVLYTGGVCTGSSTSDETLEWDGTNWNKITLVSEAGRVFGAAMAYDASSSSVLMFGGTPVGGVPRADTYTYSGGA